MERRAFAFWTVILSLFIGFIGTVMFWDGWIGLSFPLFILLIIGGLTFSSRLLPDLRIRRRNLWPVFPIVFFAAMVAVRADPIITGFNMLAVMGLGTLTLYYLPTQKFLDEATLGDYLVASLATGISTTVITPIEQLTSSWIWLRGFYMLQERKTFTAIGRGLLITAPVVIVFAALLASADEVFGKYLSDVFKIFELKDLTFFDRLFYMLVLAWPVIGILAYGLSRQHEHLPPVVEDETQAEDDEITPAEEKVKPEGFRLGMIEAGILLGSLLALFGLFVLIQFRYFFGGDANISLEGFTYAQYARRGFFELLAVSMMTLGLVLLLDGMTWRHDKREHLIFRTLSVAVIPLMLVMLFSAAQRMVLYEESYGFTHLRVYTHVFILWMGGLFLAFGLQLFRLKRNVFTLGLLVCAIGYMVTMNLLNVDHYIASRNIERFRSGGQLDVCYLRTLSVDATPAMAEFYPEIVDDPDLRGYLSSWFIEQSQMIAQAKKSIFAYNLSRQNAETIVDEMQETFPADMDWSNYRSCYWFTREGF